jgi:hypothetical protein
MEYGSTRDGSTEWFSNNIYPRLSALSNIDRRNDLRIVHRNGAMAAFFIVLELADAGLPDLSYLRNNKAHDLIQ